MTKQLDLPTIEVIENLQAKIRDLKRQLKEATKTDEINEFTLIHTETA